MKNVSRVAPEEVVLTLADDSPELAHVREGIPGLLSHEVGKRCHSDVRALSIRAFSSFAIFQYLNTIQRGQTLLVYDLVSAKSGLSSATNFLSDHDSLLCYYLLSPGDEIS